MTENAKSLRQGHRPCPLRTLLGRLPGLRPFLMVDAQRDPKLLALATHHRHGQLFEGQGSGCQRGEALLQVAFDRRLTRFLRAEQGAPARAGSDVSSRTRGTRILVGLLRRETSEPSARAMPGAAAQPRAALRRHELGRHGLRQRPIRAPLRHAATDQGLPHMEEWSLTQAAPPCTCGDSAAAASCARTKSPRSAPASRRDAPRRPGGTAGPPCSGPLRGCAAGRGVTTSTRGCTRRCGSSRWTVPGRAPRDARSWFTSTGHDIGISESQYMHCMPLI